MKNISVFFLSEKFRFLEVKLSIYLNRRVFVMDLRLMQAESNDLHDGQIFQQTTF